MSKVYNKLVRDKIPYIIENNNQKVDFTILTDEEYMIELDNKLNEEIAEYQESKNIEELADILEVLFAICKVRGISEEELMEVKLNKAKKRGTFQNKIFLKSVEPI